MYLAQHRRVNPDRALQFTFFHFLDNLTDRVRGRGVLNDTLVTVTYYPRTFDEHVPREETIEFLRSSNDRRKLFDKLGDDNFRKFFRNHTIEQAYEKDDLVQSELAETFRMLCRDEIGDYKYVTEGCDSILKQLVELRTENYFKEDLDRFETFLADRVDDLNKYMEDGFPVYGVQGDIDLDRVHRRDLVLDDSREA